MTRPTDPRSFRLACLALALCAAIPGVRLASGWAAGQDTPAGRADRPPVAAANPDPSVPASVAVAFAPGPSPRAWAIDAIESATDRIRVAAYVLTDDKIADALRAAHARGVDVAVILDARENKGRGSDGETLGRAGVRVLVDAEHPIFHDKYIVVDDELVLSGSFNWSGRASRNAEALMRIQSEGIAKQFSEDWDMHAVHAKSIPVIPDATPDVSRIIDR